MVEWLRTKLVYLSIERLSLSFKVIWFEYIIIENKKIILIHQCDKSIDKSLPLGDCFFIEI